MPAGVPTREPAREPERSRVSPVGGPSFLGLGDERTSDLDYLLEDEPPRTHGRLYLALLLLLLSGGLLAWHWQRDGYPWEGLAKSTVVGKAPASSPPEPAQVAAAPNAAPSDTAPAKGAPVGDGVQPGAGTPPGESVSSPDPITVVKPAEQAPPPADGVDAGETAAKPPAVSPQDQNTDAPAAAGSLTQKVTPEKVTPGRDTPEKEVPATETPAASLPAPPRKSAVAKPSPTTPTVSPEDRLVDQGERYLYGRGAPADCALAQRNLMIGARQSNPKAQTLLGAMYATGHCVNRDLPTAYRWFAKALHGDPGNSRVQRDLEVLWKQMTPEERQLAMKSQ